MKVALVIAMLSMAAIPALSKAQGLPTGIIFFYNSGSLCPAGSERVSEANGRLLLGTTDSRESGKQNSGVAMVDQTPYLHTHKLDFTFNVKDNDIKSQNGNRDTGTRGEKSVSLVTDESNGDLPYSQYLVCKAN